MVILCFLLCDIKIQNKRLCFKLFYDIIGQYCLNKANGIIIVYLILICNLFELIIMCEHLFVNKFPLHTFAKTLHFMCYLDVLFVLKTITQVNTNNAIKSNMPIITSASQFSVASLHLQQHSQHFDSNPVFIYICQPPYSAFSNFNISISSRSSFILSLTACLFSCSS